ncbi:hypothetical protein BD310DRAFT_433819 [Dichomitus squalens]|uniref:Uncharacterized protein n=1 Tax=Dichomitus squalens TaxID=114155 RepID=A0A4Q9PFI5_9APHY|nr:hypothetical protein BD310DRAFT_433819 [Dichomitus squalens]
MTHARVAGEHSVPPIKRHINVRVQSCSLHLFGSGSIVFVLGTVTVCSGRRTRGRNNAPVIAVSHTGVTSQRKYEYDVVIVAKRGIICSNDRWRGFGAKHDPWWRIV